MLTNNAKKAMWLNLVHYDSAPKGKVPVVLTDGSTWYAAKSNWPLEKGFVWRGDYITNCLCLGSGTRVPSAEDYCLESLIRNGLTVSLNMSSGVSSEDYYIRYDLLVTNSGSASVTIAEMGMIGNMSVSQTQGSSSLMTKQLLMDRTLLNTPVTLAPGEQAVIRYEMSMAV